MTETIDTYAEAPLFGGEDLAGVILGAAVDAIVVIDGERIVRAFNPAAQRLFGYSESEVLGRNVRMLMPEPHRSSHDGYVNGYLNTGRARVIGIGREVSGRRKDGGEAPLRLSLGEFTRDGKRYFVGILNDLTAQRRAEAERDEQREFLSAAVNGAGLGTWHWDLGDGRLRINDRWLDMLGYEHDRFEPHVRAWRRLVHPDDLPRVKRRLARHLQGASPHYESTHRMRAASGGWRWVLDCGRVSSRGENDDPRELAGVILDVTARVRAERQLARLASIVEHSDDAIIGMALSGIIDSWNSGAENLYGYAASEALGMPFSSLISEGRAEDFPELLMRIAEGENVEWFESEHVRRDGSLLPVSLNLSPIKNRSGRVTGAAATARDITVLKQAEAALIEARENAEQMARMRSDLVNTISHELRTPLTVILGNAPLLTDAEALPEPREVAEIAVDIVEDARHLLALINDLLDISKIEAGRLGLVPEPLDARAAVLEAAEKVRRLVEDKGLSLDASSDTVTVLADPLRFKQILFNLLSNAVKFTDSGGIAVSVSKQGPFAVIEVEDTGIGLSPDDLERIFDAFRQVDTSARRQAGGTGLGLAITRNLVELQGGAIEVESDPGRGSIFRFTVPLAKGKER
jgi:PAS domain S-box-containing protein